MVYFIAFAIANAPALSTTLPSLEVSTSLSASSGAIRSGLFVCCDWSHFCSRAATACSVSPVCAQAALANKTKPSEHHIKLLFIRMSPFGCCEIYLEENILDAVPLDTQGLEMSNNSKDRPL